MKEGDNIFTVVCNQCGKSVVLDSALGESYIMFLDSNSPINVGATTSETAYISCQCGNYIERY